MLRFCIISIWTQIVKRKTGAKPVIFSLSLIQSMYLNREGLGKLLCDPVLFRAY